MKREITITLQYDLAIGKVNLNEIVYRLKEVRDPLMLRILEEILKSYDDLISERLSQTKIYPSKASGKDLDDTSAGVILKADFVGVVRYERDVIVRNPSVFPRYLGC
jgi:hypothetical protein